MAAKQKKEAGRPSKYKDDYAEQAYKLCLLGATDAEMADFFGVAESTLNLWKLEHADFSESVKKGKRSADAEVADRLYQRAMGYTHEEEQLFSYQGTVVRANTLKHYAPETVAAIFWLKNRQPKQWRDRHELTGAEGGPLVVEVVKFAGTPAK